MVLVTLLVAGAARAGVMGRPQFGDLVIPAPGFGTTSIAAVDVNGDGRLDLVGTGGSPAVIGVMLATPDRDFAPPMWFPTAGYPAPWSFLIADCNGDGHPDAITLSEAGSAISLRLGDGTGAFGSRIDIPLDPGARVPAVGDMNHDGTPDLLVVSNVGGDSSAVSILLGLGNDQFAAPVSYLLPPPNFRKINSALCMRAVDLDGDGNLDVVIGLPSGYCVAKGGGDGTFVSHVFQDVGGKKQDLGIGDVNHDGHMDIVFMDVSNAQALVVLENGIDLVASEEIRSTCSAMAMALADVDQDGYPDLVTADYSLWDGRFCSILRGRGDGTFESPVRLGRNGSVSADWSVAVQDMNGDGAPDILLGTWAGAGILYASTPGSFPRAEPYPVPSRTDWVQLVDFNADGLADLAYQAGSAAFHARMAGSGGVFGPDHEIPSPDLIEQTSVGGFDDVSEDGRPDALLVGGNRLFTMRALEDGSFDEAVPSAPASLGLTRLPGSLAVLDFDGDGRRDVACLGGAAQVVYLFGGHGDGSFDTPTQLPLDFQACAIASGDFDGDGHADLAMAGKDGRLVLFLGAGNATFSVRVELCCNFISNTLRLRDLNGDGRDELIVGATSSRAVFIVSGNDGRKLGEPIALLTGFEISQIEISDVDHDGELDLIAANRGGPAVFLLRGDGRLGFSAPVGYTHQVWAEAVGLGDVDGDGTLDLAYGARDLNEVHVLRHTVLPPVAVPGHPVTGSRAGLSVLAAPNPVRTDTMLRIASDQSGNLRVGIFDLAGRRVRRFPARSVTAGSLETVRWDGKRDDGQRVGNGIYFIRAAVGARSANSRIVLFQ